MGKLEKRETDILAVRAYHIKEIAKLDELDADYERGAKATEEYEINKKKMMDEECERHLDEMELQHFQETGHHVWSPESNQSAESPVSTPRPTPRPVASIVRRRSTRLNSTRH